MSGVELTKAIRHAQAAFVTAEASTVEVDTDLLGVLIAALSTPPTDDLRELIDHLNGLMDSLDESVSHDQVYEQLRVAWNMALALRPGVATPPADDVREARAEIERWKDRPTITRRSHMDQIEGIERLRDLLAALSTPPADDVREVLEAIWDDGNATGLDGWVGPGRGTRPVDSEAIEARSRAIKKHGAAFEVRPRGTVTDAEVADLVDPERTPVERFADAAAEQFRSDLDYDGGEIKRRILTLAHVIAPDHPKTAAECAVCRDDEAFL